MTPAPMPTAARPAPGAPTEAAPAAATATAAPPAGAPAAGCGSATATATASAAPAAAAPTGSPAAAQDVPAGRSAAPHGAPDAPAADSAAAGGSGPAVLGRVLAFGRAAVLRVPRAGRAGAGGCEEPLRLPPFPGRGLRARRTLRAYVELVRAPAAATVPGDVLAGALAAGRGAGPRTLGLAGSSVCLYWAGMALNDWADRELDAVERPERPLPSGRIRPAAALATAAGLTAAGLAVAALAGGRRTVLRRTLPLAAAVWAYDLGVKNTPLGPAVMAAARTLDVLHGTGPGPARAALAPAAAVGAHTLALTRLSRHEVDGAPRHEPALTLTAAAALAATTLTPHSGTEGPARTATPALRAAARALASAGAAPGSAGSDPTRTGGPAEAPLLAMRAAARWAPAPAGAAPAGGGSAAFAAVSRTGGPGGAVAAVLRAAGRALAPAGAVPGSARSAAGAGRAVQAAAVGLYALGWGPALVRAVREPDGARVRGAVGAGIHSLLPLQAALVARAGAPGPAAALAAALPLVRRLARKVSST
ncbi:SCO3242 family prenyltransferase [Streptomyces sp. NPDC046876]|uniref:SCO3242 family prenyltransferase n=1 Tax=Streptomyces sp. NPDC046876 TaxID=3155616 RepID=UPI00340CA2E2